MDRGESATIRSVTLVGDEADGSASGGEAIVVLHAAENQQRDQFAAGQRPVGQLGVGVGYGMCRLRRACPVVVFDELSRYAPNVAGAQEDEVVERVFA